MFEIRLIGDDAAAARIDKHDWTIQTQPPGLAAVAIRSLLELPEVLCGKFGVDGGRLRRRASNECEQACERQNNGLHLRVCHLIRCIISLGRYQFQQVLTRKFVGQDEQDFAEFTGCLLLILNDPANPVTFYL